MDGRARPAVVRHLPRATLSQEQRVKSRDPEQLCGPLMNSTDRQVNRSPGISALEKLWLAPWGGYDLAIFGVPLIAAIVGLQIAGKPWCWLAIVPLLLLIWLVSFFRNPPRKIPD